MFAKENSSEQVVLDTKRLPKYTINFDIFIFKLYVRIYFFQISFVILFDRFPLGKVNTFCYSMSQKYVEPIIATDEVKLFLKFK